MTITTTHLCSHNDLSILLLYSTSEEFSSSRDKTIVCNSLNHMQLKLPILQWQLECCISVLIVCFISRGDLVVRDRVNLLESYVVVWKSQLRVFDLILEIRTRLLPSKGSFRIKVLTSLIQLAPISLCVKRDNELYLCYDSYCYWLSTWNPIGWLLNFDESTSKWSPFPINHFESKRFIEL